MWPSSSLDWFLTLVTKDFVPSFIPVLQQGTEIFDPAAHHEAVEFILGTFDALFKTAARSAKPVNRARASPELA
jgi:hypothetical protein